MAPADGLLIALDARPPRAPGGGGGVRRDGPPRKIAVERLHLQFPLNLGKTGLDVGIRDAAGMSLLEALRTCHERHERSGATRLTRTRHRSGRNPEAHRSIADLQQLTDESSEAPARPNAHGWVRHFALRVCEAHHTLARGYCASARNTLAIAGGGQE